MVGDLRALHKWQRGDAVLHFCGENGQVQGFGL